MRNATNIKIFDSHVFWRNYLDFASQPYRVMSYCIIVELCRTLLLMLLENILFYYLNVRL